MLLLRLGNLPGHFRRRGSRPPGVGEDMHGRKLRFFQEFQGFRKLLLRLLWEAHDEIGGDGAVGEGVPQVLYNLSIFGGVIMAIHPTEGFIAAALQGQMELWT